MNNTLCDSTGILSAISGYDRHFRLIIWHQIDTNILCRNKDSFISWIFIEKLFPQETKDCFVDNVSKQCCHWWLFSICIRKSTRYESFLIWLIQYESYLGTCMEYADVVWMIIVTITNLGFGDFTPSSYPARGIVGFLSIFGVFQIALIVGCLRNI